MDQLETQLHMLIPKWLQAWNRIEIFLFIQISMWMISWDTPDKSAQEH